MANSWSCIWYTEEKNLNFLSFREAVVEHLISYKDPTKRGRSSQSQSLVQSSKRKCNEIRPFTSCDPMYTTIFKKTIQYVIKPEIFCTI